MKGRITAKKIIGRIKPVPTDGYTPIFPNNWHAHSYGYGSGDFSSLSPMRLGPARYKDLESKNVENFYQFAKVFPDEIGVDSCTCGRPFRHNAPGPSFIVARDNAYKDDVPHRHKKKGPKPLYSCYGDIHCTYIESRWFYCSEMERLLAEAPAFARLLAMYNDGKSLELLGYDAYPPDAIDADTLYRHYCDEKRPFGHELVILTMIALGAEGAASYPWNRYHREHREVYETSTKRAKTE